MGNFNPNKPNILGMEFVPLTDSLRNLDIGTEIGYGFTVTGAPNNSLANMAEILFEPASAIAGQTVFFSVYPQGREDDTGEINVIRMPVTSIGVTGATSVGTAVNVLNSSSDSDYIQFTASTDRARLTFGIPPQIAGKRILGVEFVYQAAGTPGFTLTPTIESNTLVYPYGPYITGPATLAQVSQLGVVRFGDVNPWWSTAAGPNTQSDRMPWRKTELDRLGLAASNQLFVGVRVGTMPLSGFARLGYVGIDIYYCEESRVAYGGNALGDDSTGVLSFDPIWAGSGSDPIFTMRDTSFATPVVLPAGNYSVTISMADAGDLYNAGDHIRVPQLYQYAGVSTHPLVQVAKFKRASGGLPAQPPVSSVPNFAVASGLSVNGFTALLSGMASLPYVTAEGAPVYINPSGTSVTAVQQIHNEASPSDTSYEQVRFYARRFNPTAPGDLTVSVAGSGSAVITPAEFAALPELILGDNGTGTGWREVTLPITAVFSSDASFRNVTFAMTGVSTGQVIDQWQILVSRVTTVFTNLDGQRQTTGTPNEYVTSRYDGLQGANLTWKAPEAVGGVPFSDNLTTAVVMFSQSLAAPTGVAAALYSMPVSGIGQGCDGTPTCIPTSIYANQLTWSPIAVTGAFDHYEIQRSDDITEWQSIAYVTGHHTTSWIDWEARVAQESDYRIRSVNVSDFAGPWSTTFSNTLTSPGVGGVGDGNSVLIFTSNFAPSGSLAYVMQFEGEPVEEFTFPEAEQVELQTRFGKNFYTAHHGTERGGETFTRTVLIQGAAIAAPSLGDTFSLRDMAWDSLPYVCVRDELGNRWLANVQVPATRVRANRRLYFADITVTEVTDTPAVVTV